MRHVAQQQIWFLTGSQDLYGPDTLAQVESQSTEVAKRLDGSGDVLVPIVWKPVLKDSYSIRAAALGGRPPRRSW